MNCEMLLITALDNKKYMIIECIMRRSQEHLSGLVAQFCPGLPIVFKETLAGRNTAPYGRTIHASTPVTTFALRTADALSMHEAIS
jgi:hypothetical protein